jgi:hypothetical protein
VVVPDWQVTAISIDCDAVADDVTIMVYKDWSTRCTGYSKYGENIKREAARELKRRGRRLRRKLKCEGPECSRVIGYRDKLIAEEARVKAKQ